MLIRKVPPRVRTLSALGLVCLLAYAPPLIGLLFGAWPFDEDGPGFYEVWRQFTKNAVWQGILPLWNPHLFCGLPFMSDGGSSVLYPSNLIYWLLPALPALLVDALLHNVMLAAGGYCLARALGLSRMAAWVSAIALGLGGAVSAHIYAGHTTWHAARAYIPWELTALLLYLRSGQHRYALGLAVLIALQMGSGYPPLVLLGVGLCCGLLIAWCVTRGWRRRRGEGGSILPHGWAQAVLITGLLTIALCAVSVLPFRETLRLSVHGTGLSYEETVELSGSWRTFVRLLLPGFFGGNSDIQWSIKYSPHEEAAYGGILVLVLAAGAPFFARRRITKGNIESWHLPSVVPWLWALLPLSAVLALGDNTPVYRWLFDHSAVFRITRGPVRWMEVWMLAAALLAGFSWDGYLAARRREPNSHPARLLLRVLWMLAAGCVVLAIVLAVTISPQSALWLQMPEWNRPLDAAGKLAASAEMRLAAIFAAMTCGILAGLAASLLDRWQKSVQSPGMAPQRRAKLLLLALMTADATLVFWLSARVVPAAQMEASILWPSSLTVFYQEGERWDTNLRIQALNRGMMRDIDLFNGYIPHTGPRYFEFVSAGGKPRPWAIAYQPVQRTSLLRVVGLTHTIATEFEPANAEGSTRNAHGTTSSTLIAQAKNWKLWKHRYAVQGKDGARSWEGAWPRVYVTRHVEPVAEPQQLAALQRLSLLPFESSGRPAVAAPGAFPAVTVSAASGTMPGTVLHWQSQLNLMRTEVTTTAPAVLVQSESLYPGWRAWVNGQPAALEPVNYLFRGVAVPAGKSQVQVVYDNETYRFALFVSLCGLAALAALGTRRVRLSQSVREPAKYCPAGD